MSRESNGGTTNPRSVRPSFGSGTNILYMNHPFRHVQHATGHCTLRRTANPVQQYLLRKPTMQQHDFFQGMHGTRLVAFHQIPFQYRPKGRKIVILPDGQSFTQSTPHFTFPKRTESPRCGRGNDRGNLRLTGVPRSGTMHTNPLHWDNGHIYKVRANKST